jgi:hypothetical protein
MKALKSVGGLLGLGGAKTPAVMTQNVPSPPTIDEARNAVESRDEMLKRRGRKATILTGPGGVSDAGSTQKTSLIGN